jgi:hypothetical protein
VLLAEWLTVQFGLVEWMPILIGFLTAVLVPFLRLLAEQQAPPALRDVAPAQRSKFNRWLW